MADAAAAAADAIDEAAALALALRASLAEQRRALAAAEAEGEGEGAAELIPELRAAVAEAEEALDELRRQQEAQDEQQPETRPPKKRPRRPDASDTPLRGPYRPSPTDFATLAEAHPPLRAFLVERRKGWRSSSGPPQPPTLDFTDWRATRELTAALLSHEYGVCGWSLPEGRLVPPVPNRESCLCWIADLLALVPPPPPQSPSSSSSSSEVRGLDLGCGASLIYCLLGAAGWGWRMRGVDVDAQTLEFAAGNARAVSEAAPRLAPLLEIARAAPTNLAPVAASLAATTTGPVAAARWSDLPGAGDGVLARALKADVLEWKKTEGGDDDDNGGLAADSSSSFAFCVCNPPFFESEADAGGNPRTACGGTAQEMVCPGGELAFVASMVADSAALALARERWQEGGDKGGDASPPPPPPSVHWFSTMVGKKSTLKAVRAALHELSRAPLPDEPPRARVTAVRTTTLAPQVSGGGGGKAATTTATTRWCIAWTFSPAARGTDLQPLPPRGEELMTGGAWLLREEEID